MQILTLAALVGLTVVDLNALTPTPPPEAYLHPADQERARRHDPNDAPCAIRVKEGGVETVSFLPTDQCVKMLPARRMTGVWIDAFEGSLFYPNVERPPHDPGGESIWLNVDRAHLRHGFASGGGNGRAVLVDFIGRQTQYRGHYGHLGMFDHEIIVDRLLSARELSAPDRR